LETIEEKKSCRRVGHKKDRRPLVEGSLKPGGGHGSGREEASVSDASSTADLAQFFLSKVAFGDPTCEEVHTIE